MKMTCRDSSTKGALLSVVDPAAWVMLSPPRKKTAPDYERWRNRLDFQSAYEPDLSATSHLVSPSEPALSPSMSEISDCTFDGYSSPIPVRSFDAVSPPPPILSEDDISHKSMREASTVCFRLNRREPPVRRWRKPRVRPHQRAALRAWRGGRLVFEAGRTHGKFERRPLPVAFNPKVVQVAVRRTSVPASRARCHDDGAGAAWVAKEAALGRSRRSRRDNFAPPVSATGNPARAQ